MSSWWSQFHYPILFAAAVLLGMWITSNLSRNPQFSRRAYLLGVVGGVFGARFWFSLQYGFGSAGLSYFGFALGAVTSVALFHRFTRSPPGGSDFPDSVTPALALGSAVHRVGCFISGCCFGQVCALPWAVQYPNGSPAFQKQLAAGLVAPTDQWTHPIHPTQLYGTLTGVLLFGLLLYLLRFYRERFLPHEIFLACASFYAIYRFLMEFLRDDAGGRHFGPLTFSQATAVLVFLIASSVLIIRRIRHRCE